MSRRTIIGGMVAAAAATLTIGLSVPAALAGTSGTPSPYPTPTETVKCPPGTVLVGDRCVPVRPRLHQQEFDLLENNLLPNGWVLGTGPINIVGGVDRTTNNPRVDFFDTADLGSGVRINHEPLFGSVVDRRTCSITISQFDLPWSIHQGFGRFLGATGSGVYDLEGLFSFPTRYNRCTLPFGLTGAQADRDLNGGYGLPEPLAFSVSVQAVGLSAVVPPRPKPEPCPTRTIFAPVNGSPAPDSVCPSPTRSVFAPAS